MKQILTLLFAASLFSTSFAQGRSNNNKKQHKNETDNNNGQYENNKNDNLQNSALSVNSSSQNDFTVSVDNGKTYPSNSNTVTLRTLSPGNHLVTVTQYFSSILGKPAPKVIYNSNITFKAGVKTILNIDNNGQANITEKQMSGNGDNGNIGNDGNNGNNGKGKKMKKSKNPHDNRNHDKPKNKDNKDKKDKDDNNDNDD